MGAPVTTHARPTPTTSAPAPHISAQSLRSLHDPDRHGAASVVSIEETVWDVPNSRAGAPLLLTNPTLLFEVCLEPTESHLLASHSNQRNGSRTYMRNAHDATA
jgi:hypothetical protein